MNTAMTKDGVVVVGLDAQAAPAPAPQPAPTAAPASPAPDPVTSTRPPSGYLTNHNKVSASGFAGALVMLLLPICKQKFGLDLSGQEVALTVVIMSAVGYITKNPD